MKNLIFSTDDGAAGLILRLTLALIMFPHGAQKMFGAFGGYGFSATMQYFTINLKLPWLLSLAIILIEFLCPIGFILGLASRISAILLLTIMVGAIAMINYKNGFFMNWFNQQPGEGFEYHLIVIGMCIALLVTGSGKYSVDRLLPL